MEEEELIREGKVGRGCSQRKKGRAVSKRSGVTGHNVFSQRGGASRPAGEGTHRDTPDDKGPCVPHSKWNPDRALQIPGGSCPFVTMALLRALGVSPSG